MSVMQALKQFSGEEGTSNFPKFRQGQGGNKEQLQETEEMMMASPIPGQSLTQDPESRLPYEKPSKFTNLQDFIDETFLRFTNEDALPDLLDTMRHGLPVEHIAEKYLMRTFRDGDINPDMLLLAIEPTIYMLISLATYAQIDPVLYPEDHMSDEEVPTEIQLYRQATESMLEPEARQDNRITINELSAPSVLPQSLLARSKQAVGDMNVT